MRQSIERTFVCPDLQTQSDVMIVQHEMDNTPAVLESEISLSEQSIHVKLGDLDGETSVRHHLTSVGFPPKD